ncbi:LacI family DNA-binding transcriptional regulator [Streptomyces cavourensis]|uniref:LacI family DNA-binding transcriptional regulator n=1 Tax=Streptomyces cavourensis TaxID=67258 RepID=UPI0021AFF6A3|nr:LacI family DNA-binding transcriptional regulator [Streptomyces cavourensis]
MSEREPPPRSTARRRAPAPHVTLAAVAREAGVSPATASRALNGTTRVRDELRLAAMLVPVS